MFGRETVADVEHDHAAFGCDARAMGLVRVEIAEHPAATVEEDHRADRLAARPHDARRQRCLAARDLDRFDGCNVDVGLGIEEAADATGAFTARAGVASHVERRNATVAPALAPCWRVRARAANGVRSSEFPRDGRIGQYRPSMDRAVNALCTKWFNCGRGLSPGRCATSAEEGGGAGRAAGGPPQDAWSHRAAAVPRRPSAHELVDVGGAEAAGLVVLAAHRDLGEHVLVAADRAASSR